MSVTKLWLLISETTGNVGEGKAYLLATIKIASTTKKVLYSWSRRGRSGEPCTCALFTLMAIPTRRTETTTSHVPRRNMADEVTRKNRRPPEFCRMTVYKENVRRTTYSAGSFLELDTITWGDNHVPYSNSMLWYRHPMSSTSYSQTS